MASSLQSATLFSRDAVAASPDQSREISWTTIFWILAAVASNTMIQPGGIVVRAPPEFSFMLRVSPVICIVDTFSMMVDFIYWCVRSDWRKAQARLLHSRFEIGQRNDDEPSYLAELQKNTAIRRVLAAVALVQAVRVYAFRHCAFAQAIVSAYLASFFLVKALVFRSEPATRKKVEDDAGPRNRSSEMEGLAILYVMLACCALCITCYFVLAGEALNADARGIVGVAVICLVLVIVALVHSDSSDHKMVADDSGRLTRSSQLDTFTAISIIFACGINFYFITTILNSPTESHGSSLAIWAGAALISTSVLIVLVCLVVWAQHHSKSFTGSLVTGLVALLLTILLTLALLIEKLHPLFDTRYRFIAIALFLGCVGGGAAVSRATTLGFTRQVGYARGGQRRTERYARRYIQQGAAWLFVVSNVLTAVVYLKFGYQSEGTWAPTWTDFLG